MVDPDVLLMVGHVVDFDIIVRAWVETTGDAFTRKAPQKGPC